MTPALKAGKFEMPRTVAEAQRILVEFGYEGFTISNIDSDRIYVITPLKQYPLGMRRCARTFVLSEEGDDIRAKLLDGWIVE